MKKLIPLVILLSYTINMHAQSYLSPTPVDEGSYELTSNISGTWKVEKYHNAGQAYTITADPNKKGQVHIVHGFSTMTPAIVSKMGNNLFLSLYEVGGPEQQEGFYIFLLDILSETNVRLVPLKYDIELPEGQSLKQFLMQPGLDMQTILQPQAINLTNKYFVVKRPLDTSGRKINIVSKNNIKKPPAK